MIYMISEFEQLIQYLQLALDNLDNNSSKINDELNQWKSEIDIEKLAEGLKLILDNVLKWYDEYKKSKNILSISLKEYDIVSKESSYLLGEASLINDLYLEQIDWIIGNIGILMCNDINKGGKVNE